MQETEKVVKRYEKRKSLPDSLYSILKPYVYLARQERERELLRILQKIAPVHNKRVLEIGCGAGSNLLQLIQMGFEPGNLVGNELLENRFNAARHRLPEAVKLILGDAAKLDLEPSSFDIVYQSTVFTSLLDNDFQHKLAKHMWQLVKSGGGVLWYDFIYNNPKNPDVRGVPLRRIKELFPQGNITMCQKVTLAPPIGRFVTNIHPGAYSIFNAFPFLRTHVLAWIEKKF